MEVELFGKGDLVHVAQGAKRFCTVIGVSSKEPKYKVQFVTDTRSIERFKSYELTLVQRYAPRENN
jgi:hypothetical protein